jgi:hypothetical protein
MVEICTGGNVMLHFVLTGSRDPVQTNELRFQARQRYASEAAVLCVQSHAAVWLPMLLLLLLLP